MEEYKGIKNLTVERFQGLEIIEELFLKYIGVPQDYSIQALALVEEFMNEKFPESSVKHSTTYLPPGWYFGKVIVKNLEGATWQGDANDMIDISIRYKIKNHGEAVIFPFRRIMNWWEDRTDGLVPFFHMINYFNKYGIPDASHGDKDGWIEKDGFKFRVKKSIETDLSKGRRE